MTDTNKAKSWRDVLPIHAAANLFPLMLREEQIELGNDIKSGTMEVPIVLIEVDKSRVKVNGRPIALLDGRNRLDALEATGHRINFETIQDEKRGGPFWYAEGESTGVATFTVRIKLELASKLTDAYTRVLSLNIHRRHLTAEQKREVIAKLLKATPEKSDRQIASITKASPTTVGTVRTAMERTGDVSKLDTRRDTKGRKQPTKKKKRRAADDSWRSDYAKRVADELAAEEAEQTSEDLAQRNPIETAWRIADDGQRIAFVRALRPALMRIIAAADAPPVEASSAKRKRGRPKGSKNKPKEINRRDKHANIAAE